MSYAQKVMMATLSSAPATTTMCAACGKEEDGDTKLKFCNAVS